MSRALDMCKTVPTKRALMTHRDTVSHMFSHTSQTVALFGASQNTRRWLEGHRERDVHYFVIDNNDSLEGSEFAGLQVRSPNCLLYSDFSKVVVAFAHADSAVRQLRQLGVPRDAIYVAPLEESCPRFFQTSESRDAAWKFAEEVLGLLEGAGLEVIFEHGTALGFVRQGDFIEGDFDIDASIPEVQIESISPAHIRELLAASPLVSGVSISSIQDITLIEATSVHDKVPFSIFGRRSEQGISRSSLSFESVPDSILRPPSRIEVRQSQVPVPYDYVSYLELVYGLDWKTPKASWSFLSYANIDLGGPD